MTLILLLGGTSETAPLARALAEAGYAVLVSKATSVPLEMPAHPRIRVRSGALDLQALSALLHAEHIGAVVDAAHPFALIAHTTARQAAAQAKLPYLRYVRPATTAEVSETVCWAATHDEAARLAVAFGRPMLLTTGSRNLAPYVQAAATAGVPLVARVLCDDSSVAACLNAGIPAERIVTGRGPFSVEANRDLLRRFKCGVLVTKDSGEAGGVPAKLAAAKAENCRVVMLCRPEQTPGEAFDSAAALLERLANLGC